MARYAMRFRVPGFILALACSGGAHNGFIRTATAADDARRFDGTWSTTLVCEDFRDTGRGAKGYTFRFLSTVKNGELRGEHGRSGQPSWLLYEGRIAPDGSAEIDAKGLTGKPDYSVGQVANATPYSYRLKGQFDASRGVATRVDLRPCKADFVKQ